MKKSVLIFVIFLIIFSFSVQAVGLSSYGSMVKEIDFVPNQQHTFAYMLRTTVDFPQDYHLFAEGDLAHLVTFSPSSQLKNIAPGEDPWFNVIINFPASEGNITPGLHTIKIGIIESPSGGGMVSAKTSVTTRIVVRVLHPGKFLIANLNAPNVNINDPVRAVIRLENWGKQTINFAQASLDIYTQEGLFQESITTDSASVPGAQSNEIYAVLDTLGYLPGDYFVEGTVNWDGQQTPVNDTFKIGTQDIKINSYTATFERDKINPFIINIESVWNSPTPNVYAIINLPNGQIQTPTISLAPWQNRNLTAYWDTSGVELGQYDAQIKLFYAGQSKTENVEVEVLERVEVQEQKPLGFNYIFLVTIIVALILVNIFLWYFFIRKKKKPEDFPKSQNF